MWRRKWWAVNFDGVDRRRLAARDYVARLLIRRKEEGECELPKRGGVFLTYKGGTREHLPALAEPKLACSPHMAMLSCPEKLERPPDSCLCGLSRHERCFEDADLFTTVSNQIGSSDAAAIIHRRQQARLGRAASSTSVVPDELPTSLDQVLQLIDRTPPSATLEMKLELVFMGNNYML
ncbi:hypothetical protein BHE74_00012415 [Ensete ventricosum]|nr:hypothetical protein BHE74_00012415 [Ensete ventricosum]